ncbi:MAG: hypothetical protein ACOVRN_17345 [Flavobacterium sp.]
MDDFNFEEFKRETAEIEEAKIELRLTKIEEDAVKDILRYFDRIHDNLSNYNNLLIGAFFALAQFQKNISRWTILIPIMNLWFLIYINYRLMEKSRFEASIKNQPFDQINKHGKKTSMTNLLSLLSIISTVVVSIAFLYYLAIY